MGFTSSPSKSTNSDSSWVDEWNRAVSENVRMMGPPPSYESSILEARSTRDVVVESVKAKLAGPRNCITPDQLFLAAVASAQTHPDLVDSILMSGDHEIPPIVSVHVATFLRYADSIDKSLEALANLGFPAAILFGSIRFMVSFAVKEINLFITMESQFEQVSLRLHRLDIYLAMESPTEAVKSMLRKVMIDILRFCSLATMYLKSNLFRRSFKLKNQLETVIQDLEKDTLIEIASGVAQVNSGVEQIIANLARHRIDAPLPSPTELLFALNSWLQAVSVTEHQRLLDRNHYLPSTCQWIRQNKTFCGWMENHLSTHLWVHGLPGAGKSILAAYSVSIIEEMPSSTCCYFFCNWNEPTKRSVTFIIRTIVSQLARNNPSYLQALTDLRLGGYNLFEPLPLVWQHLVVDNLIHLSEHVYVIVDGLDECNSEERKLLMDIIISTRQDERVSWLVFSRYLSDVADIMQSPSIALLPEDNANDLAAYIEQRVSSSRLLSNPQIKYEVAASLHKEARGVFLWVKLIIQELEQQRSLVGVRAVLQSLPLGMESLYNRILESLNHILRDQQPRITSEVFGWIACAARLLTVSELTKGIELSLPDIGELLDLKIVLQEDCGALVSVSTSSLVQFIHQTAHQYLCSDRCSPRRFAVNQIDMHKRITTVCLKYLCTKELPSQLSLLRFTRADKESINQKYPLLGYAAMYWPEHIGFDDINGDSDLVHKVETFLTSNSLLLAMETVLTFHGIEALRVWYAQLCQFKDRFHHLPQVLVQFIGDLQYLISHHGHVLDENPNEIHYLIDECFPQNSHFWKHFGHHEIEFASGHCEEWDPCIALLDNIHVNCIAVSPSHYLAAADTAGISILNMHTRVEICRLAKADGCVIAMTFDHEGDSLAVLTNDGSLRLISTKSWQIIQVFSQVVSLPPVISKWNESRFWSLYFLHFDPAHINFDFIGKTIFAGNSHVDCESGKIGQGLPKLSLSLSASQYACTKDGELFGVLPTGDIVKRSAGSPRSTILRLSQPDKQQQSLRLLAISRSGKLMTTCPVDTFSGHTMSHSYFNCIEVSMQPKSWRGTFENNYKITAAAFSADERMLAVNAHNAKNLLDITKIWSLGDEPQLIWEQSIFDDHATSLAFALKDAILVKAGRYVRLWDTSLIRKTSRRRNVFPLNLAIKISHRGTWIASVLGEQAVGENPRLFLHSTEQRVTPVEITWPSNLPERNVFVTEPLAWSPDDKLIIWDYALFSATTHKVVRSFTLQTNEKICRVGGFNHDSSLVIYGVDRRAPRQRRRDLPIDQLDVPRTKEMAGDRSQYIVCYNLTTDERWLLFSFADIAALRLHSTLPLLGTVSRENESENWKAYIFTLASRQCVVSAAFPTTSLLDLGDIYFSGLNSLDIILPQRAWREGREFGGAWTDVEMFRLPISDAPEQTYMRPETLTIPNWHICHFLPSGKVLYFMQDGWVALWDDDCGLTRVKYLPPLYQWSIAASCTTARERNGVIRVGIHSLTMGVFWFDIDSDDEPFECTFSF